MNCGQCCKIPGIFLPEQLDHLKDSLHLDMEELFRGYLIAELFTPSEDLDPIFILSPVKADESGERIPVFFADGNYHHIRHLHCIFWNNDKRECAIYDKKPFGCSVLLCDKMTETEPILIRKQYYYHKWLDYQNILFGIFPHLEEYTFQLQEVSSSGRRGVAEVTSGLNQSSAFM